ncbi:gliding motility-associated C-terminal domain-containing protein [Ekhidna sp.]|uniref:T9SS type B sorting domain-containing protein n=1 Tax=Ekhidna sp. TaxID=2608089 RepID=UPI003297D14D
MKRFKILLLLIMACFFKLSAQNLLTNDNSLVVVNTGVPFTIEGDLSNSGIIRNEGAMRLHGNWANSGDYSSVSGSFYLIGQNQLFAPGESTYSQLSVKSGGVVILSDLHITESLELIDGIVSIVAGSKVLLQSNARISGGDVNSYIDGSLFTTTQGDFTFTIGTEAEYLPVTLKNIRTTDSVGVKAFNSSLNASISSELDAFSETRYWEVMGGSSFEAQSIGLPLLNESFIESEDEAVIAFTTIDDQILNVLGIPEIVGSLESGTINTPGNILAGYYVLGDQSMIGPPITVINVVTSLQDGKHDFLRIDNIEFYENNLVEIFDRQGVKVFEMTRYNNSDRVFKGSANVGSRGVLQTGNYYYTVKLTNSKRESGFVYIKN